MAQMPMQVVEPSQPPAENPGGLFSAVTFRVADNERIFGAGAKFPGVPGGILESYGAIECGQPLETVFTDKIGWAEIDPFTVYGTFKCTPVGYTPEDAEQAAIARLAAFEEVSAEAYVWANALDNAAELTATGLTQPTDNIAHAVGLLEHHAIRNYGGGIIHVPRHLAHLLPDLNTTGNRVTLSTGVQVVLGSGYGEPGAETSLVVTPPLVGYRSDVEIPYNTRQVFDREKNNLTATAQRIYIIGWDAVGEPAKINITI